MDKINEFLKENHRSTMVAGKNFLMTTKRIKCNDGFSISIQANEYSYCKPRQNRAWPYDAVELGFPSALDDLIKDYAEESGTSKTVFGYVPIDAVIQLIEKHGGIKD